MRMATAAYPAETFDIGVTRDGRKITLSPMTPEAAEFLGPACAAIGPWAHYGLPGGALAKGLASSKDGLTNYQVRIADEPAGAVMIRDPWLIGPYLALLAVLPRFQGQKVGDALLGWYEMRARSAGHRQAWLCVSGFNTDAQRFYRAHGWQKTALIPGLITTGEDELLMRKMLQT
jgi:ribosomal protein S18 acetylase RimI-like enzyme